MKLMTCEKQADGFAYNENLIDLRETFRQTRLFFHLYFNCARYIDVKSFIFVTNDAGCGAAATVHAGLRLGIVRAKLVNNK